MIDIKKIDIKKLLNEIKWFIKLDAVLSLDNNFSSNGTLKYNRFPEIDTDLVIINMKKLSKEK